MQPPRHVLDAPSHPDPYGWYAQVRRTRPLFLDDALGCWVVAAPRLVREALAHPALRVRPPREPVPPALRGRRIGEVFAQLVRMTDGAHHARHRPAVQARVQGWTPAQVDAAAADAASAVAATGRPQDWLGQVPVQAVARLLGVAAAELDDTVRHVQAFTRAIGPAADAAAVEQGDRAAAFLMAQGEREGLDPATAANRLALMQQALDATAGLIGNAVLAWRAAPAPLAGLDFVAGIAQRDPAIHNTRRFAAEDLHLGGERITAGQGLVLLLVGDGAEAGCPFGHGAHACPGEALALRIAAAALRSWEAEGRLRRFGPPRGYRPLPNARIPVFASEEETP
ncbi:MAG: cytochrome P450 [Ramlibacter sp.]